MSASFFGDQSNFELTDRHRAVRTVKMSIHSRAGLHFEYLLFVVERPDARKSRAEMICHRFGARLEQFIQRRMPADQNRSDVRAERFVVSVSFLLLFYRFESSYVVRDAEY